MSVYYKILLFESKKRATNVFRPKINQGEDVTSFFERCQNSKL